MFEKAIQKLRNERAKLTRNAKEFDTKYKSEIRRIDTAIQKFEEGMAVLGSKDSLPRGSATREIENILAEHGTMHVRAVTEELHRRGHSMRLQSVSCALQTAAKKNKKYKRVSPATFALVSKGKRTARTNATA
jgi:hypothetical protein